MRICSPHFDRYVIFLCINDVRMSANLTLMAETPVEPGTMPLKLILN